MATQPKDEAKYVKDRLNDNESDGIDKEFMKIHLAIDGKYLDIEIERLLLSIYPDFSSKAEGIAFILKSHIEAILMLENRALPQRVDLNV